MTAPPVSALGLKVPPGIIVLVAVAVGLAVMVWHKFGQDPEDTNWLDPGQPPMSVAVDFTSTIAGMSTTVPGAPDGGFKAPRCHAKSLIHMPCCWVGDC